MCRILRGSLLPTVPIVMAFSHSPFSSLRCLHGVFFCTRRRLVGFLLTGERVSKFSIFTPDWRVGFVGIFIRRSRSELFFLWSAGVLYRDLELGKWNPFLRLDWILPIYVLNVYVMKYIKNWITMKLGGIAFLFNYHQCRPRKSRPTRDSKLPKLNFST